MQNFNLNIQNLSPTEIIRCLRREDQRSVVLQLCDRLEEVDDLESQLYDIDPLPTEEQLQDEIEQLYYDYKCLEQEYTDLKNKANMWHILSDESEKIIKD